jgi:hypothetical protein
MAFDLERYHYAKRPGDVSKRMGGDSWSESKIFGPVMLAYLSRKYDGENGFALEEAGITCRTSARFWGPHAQP